MGLDMYLDVTRNVYRFMDEAKFNELKTALDSVIFKNGFLSADERSDDVLSVGRGVAYWRKANAIHAWFVENVQDGIDECQTSYVPIEALEELERVCGEVVILLDPYFRELHDNSLYDWDVDGTWEDIPSEVLEKIEEVLPTQAGFFFGSTAIDLYYYANVKYTYDRVSELRKWIVAERENGSYWEVHYRSSW